MWRGPCPMLWSGRSSVSLLRELRFSGSSVGWKVERAHGLGCRAGRADGMLNHVLSHHADRDLIPAAQSRLLPCRRDSPPRARLQRISAPSHNLKLDQAPGRCRFQTQIRRLSDFIPHLWQARLDALIRLSRVIHRAFAFLYHHPRLIPA